MAKLTRETAKIFGETASTTNTPVEIGQFGSAKAGTYNATGDIATIQSLSAWSNGWIDAVTPTDQFPPLPEMTAVHKVLSYQNAYVLQQGMPEWDSATTYYANGFCSQGGLIYRSIEDNNLNNSPADSPTKWEIYGAITDYANQSLTNLTTLGNARLQYAPFSINSGTVSNGKNATLKLPGGSQTTVEVGFVQPILSANGTLGGDSFAVLNSYNTGSYYTWKMFDGNSSTAGALGLGTGTLTIYNPIALKVSEFEFLGWDMNSVTSVKGSNDGTNYTSITFSSSKNGSVVTATLTNSNFYKYYQIDTYGASNYYAYECNITATWLKTITASETVICDPCVITTCDGRTLVDGSSSVFEVTNEADGDYFIFKNQTNGALTVSNNLRILNIPKATPSDGDYWLDTSVTPANLKIYDTSDWTINNDLVWIGKCTISSGAIITIENRLFNDNGYSEGTSTGASWAMPSDTYEDLTLGANGATYTAPANGYFGACFNGSSNLSMFNKNNRMSIGGTYSSGNYNIFIPAKKGEEVTLFYNGTKVFFRFIYAQGSESEAS